jgi:hypothetical protein
MGWWFLWADPLVGNGCFGVAPLRRVTFEKSRKPAQPKVTKRLLPHHWVPRCRLACPHSDIAARGPPPTAIHGLGRLSRRPAGLPHAATSECGLRGLTGRSRSKAKAKAKAAPCAGLVEIRISVGANLLAKRRVRHHVSRTSSLLQDLGALHCLIRRHRGLAVLVRAYKSCVTSGYS